MVLLDFTSRHVSVELELTAGFQREAKHFKIDVLAQARRR